MISKYGDKCLSYVVGIAEEKDRIKRDHAKANLEDKSSWDKG